jgi:hypothetical protein
MERKAHKIQFFNTTASHGTINGEKNKRKTKSQILTQPQHQPRWGVTA